jgi:aminoglycoside phosphotransferase (APT) family kinase protein
VATTSSVVSERWTSPCSAFAALVLGFCLTGDQLSNTPDLGPSQSAWPSPRRRCAVLVRLAVDLAGFLTALRSTDPVGGLRPGKHNWFRGGTLRTYDGAAQSALTAERWFHGDVAEGNLPLDDGQLAAVMAVLAEIFS